MSARISRVRYDAAFRHSHQQYEMVGDQFDIIHIVLYGHGIVHEAMLCINTHGAGMCSTWGRGPRNEGQAQGDTNSILSANKQAGPKAEQRGVYPHRRHSMCAAIVVLTQNALSTSRKITPTSRQTTNEAKKSSLHCTPI